MKVAIVGGRTFNDYNLLKKTMDELYEGIIISEIVSGGAKGADTLAEKYAKENGIKIKVFLPDWTNLGKKAGPIRNEEIIKYCYECVAFWDGVSTGTLSSINLSKKHGKKCSVIKY